MGHTKPERGGEMKPGKRGTENVDWKGKERCHGVERVRGGKKCKKKPKEEEALGTPLSSGDTRT